MFLGHLADLRPQTTAHLATTMSFLQLPTAELEARLLKELDKNPALELVEEWRCPQCGKRLRRSPCPRCAVTQGDDGPVVCLAQRPDYQAHATHDDELDISRDVRAPERLDEHILRQIGPALTMAERPLAAYLLARLDEHGLLPESVSDVALFKRVPLSAVERVLHLIQHADPPGVGATTPTEALLIQLNCLAETLPAIQRPTLQLARLIIQDHMEALSKHDAVRLARQLHLPVSSVEEAFRFIQRNLTPYPALAFWGEGHNANINPETLHNPDVTISFLNQDPGGPLLVEVFTPLNGWLRVNPELKAAFTDAPEGATADPNDKWAQAVSEAALIAKCLQQRNHTMRRLMHIIALEQRAFILGGDGDLRPLTRAAIAQTLGVHESTISRAVAGKAVALPDGRLVPLSKFFDRSLSVRDRVRLLVEAEPKARPLTDDQIAEALAEEGLQVARRTVAKYRKMLGILPAHMRLHQRPITASHPEARPRRPAPAVSALSLGL